MHLELRSCKRNFAIKKIAQGCFAAQQLPRVQLLLQVNGSEYSCYRQPGPLAHQQKSPEFQLDRLQRLAGQADSDHPESTPKTSVINRGLYLLISAKMIATVAPSLLEGTDTEFYFTKSAGMLHVTQFIHRKTAPLLFELPLFLGHKKWEAVHALSDYDSAAC